MAKPEWGSKRICPSCGTRYYDLMREPVICPKCSTPFDPEAFLKSRRARPAAPVEKELEPVGADELDTELEPDEAEVAEEEEEEAAPLEEAEEEDEELLEDASELGEDEDDMAEVIENVEEEEH
ncbi:MAG: TIGR02300 family protein [Stellaceae bacterium]